MIAIQSYYFDRELLEWEKQCWELSYNSIKSNSNISDIVIYTNDISKVPFEASNIILFPVDYSEQFKKGWWQIYKQFLYQYINEPFIHIDIDLILISDIGELKGDIICEKTRGNNTFTGIESSQGYERPMELICSGIMGGSNSNSHFKESFEKTIDFINSYNGRVLNSYRWALEEGILASIANRDNLLVNEVNKGSFEHYQGTIYKNAVKVHELIKMRYNILKNI